MNNRLLIPVACLALYACEGKIGVAGSDPSLLTAEERDPAEKQESVDPIESPDVVDDQTSTPVTPTVTEEPEVVYEVPDFTGEEVVAFARSISQMLVSRPLSAEEVSSLTAGGVDALEPMLRAWANEPAFAENARFLMQTKLKASGQRDDIDMNLPGNLVAHVVRNDLPWSTILTADYCVDGGGQTVTCDSGAPYVAGVLTTRAYLAGNASRFNLGRALTMMEAFACRIYPMEEALQPYIAKEELIPMFRANSVAEQTVEEAAGGFGNGNGCYTCHGQFGAHAQLFVKFDETGMYRNEATGLQDPEGELGRSFDGLMTSHFDDPAEAALEATQMFGQPVQNLAEAARVLASSDPFLDCQAEGLLHHTFGLPEAAEVEHAMLEAITERARELHANPTFADLVVATFTEPRVILSVVGARNSGGDQ